MLKGNYEQILNLISKSSGISVEDIERKIEAKRAKLSGLISKEGAAQIVASELGINFEKQQMKISELLTGMKKINVIGKIVKINRVVEYNKNGRSGKIGSFLLADDSSNIRVVLWDTNHISLIEDGTIKQGDSVEITAGDVRNSEMHLTGFSDLKRSSVVFEKVEEKPQVQFKQLSDINANDNVVLRAFILQIYGPNFFNACPVCGKKLISEGQCGEHGSVQTEKRAILNFILDDGTDTIRATLFWNQIKKIAQMDELDDPEKFLKKRDELLGKEMIFETSIRRNQLYENLEAIINDLKEVDLDEVIKELESPQKN